MSPDQIMPIALMVVMVIVAIVLVAVGWQLFLLLKDTRATMRSINQLVNNVDHKVDVIINPIRTLGSLAAGMAGGMKAFEAFSVWLKHHKTDKQINGIR
jgi:hypothetical protein